MDDSILNARQRLTEADTEYNNLLDQDQERPFTEADRKHARAIVAVLNGDSARVRRLHWHKDDCGCGMCTADRSK